MGQCELFGQPKRLQQVEVFWLATCIYLSLNLCQFDCLIQTLGLPERDTFLVEVSLPLLRSRGPPKNCSNAESCHCGMPNNWPHWCRANDVHLQTGVPSR